MVLSQRVMYQKLGDKVCSWPFCLSKVLWELLSPDWQTPILRREIRKARLLASLGSVRFGLVLCTVLLNTGSQSLVALRGKRIFRYTK